MQVSQLWYWLDVDNALFDRIDKLDSRSFQLELCEIFVCPTEKV